MNYQKSKDYRKTHGPYSQRLGIFVEEIGPGYARVTKTIGPEDLNPLGLAHGGVYYSMADTACGSAASSYGFMAVTVNANYNYLRSAKPGDTLIAEGTECKTGKRICVYDVRVTTQAGTHVGTGTFTYYLLDRKIAL